MAIGTIEVGEEKSDGKLHVTLRGDVEQVVRVLAQGLPVEDLQALKDVLNAELQKRGIVPSSSVL